MPQSDMLPNLSGQRWPGRYTCGNSLPNDLFTQMVQAAQYRVPQTQNILETPFLPRAPDSIAACFSRTRVQGCAIFYASRGICFLSQPGEKITDHTEGYPSIVVVLLVRCPPINCEQTLSAFLRKLSIMEDPLFQLQRCRRSTIDPSPPEPSNSSFCPFCSIRPGTSVFIDV